MENILGLIGILATYFLVAIIWYKVGYEKRERQFQKGPILFADGVENVCKVYRENGNLKMKIYNEKLIEIIT